MNRLGMALIAALVGIGTGLGLSRTVCNGQVPKRASTESVPVNDGPRVAFTILSLDDVEQTVALRNLAVQTAIETLEARKKGETIDDLLVSRSANLLGQLRADDSRAIKALIANLDFKPAISEVGEPHPLETLDVARALRRIGGHTVAEELIRCLRVQRTKKEQVIIANILVGCDTPEVTAFRLRLAIEAEEADKNPDQDYIGQLKAVKYCLDNSALLNKPDNWPNTM